MEYSYAIGTVGGKLTGWISCHGEFPMLRIGGPIQVVISGRKLDGCVEDIILPTRILSEEEITRYYGKKPSDRVFPLVSQTRYPRIVGVKSNGHHFVIPYSPKFRGTIFASEV